MGFLSSLHCISMCGATIAGTMQRGTPNRNPAVPRVEMTPPKACTSLSDAP